MTLAAGTKLDGYEVLGPLGAGGMGEVYRARDSVLKREVAIKVLPSFVSQDPERLRRFQQEAQATAALNHPNILAVYAFGTFEGAPYLVSELLEGGTLGQQLTSGAMPVRKAIDCAVQIARGLAAAHEKGIVHRDLKPDNIFVLKDGRVKILDFGLAKLTQKDAATADGPTISLEEQTNPGMVLGTIGYMSPEQVRGKTADHQADIFAFGAILYEMLSGKRAFRKPTSAETMTAILKEDPPAISQMVPGAAPGLVRVVHRCLEKNPEQRFQSASDLAFALEALSESGHSSTAAIDSGPRSRRIWLAAAGAALVLAAVLLTVWWRIPPAVPVVESITQLTSDGECKWGKLASDGSRIYFNEGRQAGNFKISQVSVTGGPTAPVETRVDYPWIAGLNSQGSALLAFANGIGDSGYPLWSIPLPAGEPRRLGNLAGQDANLFPDGRILLVSGRDIFVADADGSNSRKLPPMPGIVILEEPSVSPDGKQIGFTGYSRGWSTAQLFEAPADGSARPTALRTGENQHPCCANWSADGKYLIFGNRHGGERSDIWALPVRANLIHPTMEPVRLTAGPLSYFNAIPSRDGKQIFANGAKLRSELVRYDMKQHQFLAFLGDISAIGPTFSYDGKWVAYTSYPDHTLWRSRTDGTERAQLTYSPMEVGAPSISPDGTKVAFRDVDWDLHVVNMDGGGAQVIAKHSDAPSWSPDGNLLLFTSYTDAALGDEARSYLQIFDLRTGKTEMVPSSQNTQGGTWITQDTLVATPYNPTKFQTFDLKTQKWTDISTGDFVSWIVSQDGKYLYFTTRGTEPEVRRLRFADRQTETITSLKDFRTAIDILSGAQIDIAPDGSPVLARDIGTWEIYALNIRWP